MWSISDNLRREEQTKETAAPIGAGYRIFSVVRTVFVYLFAAAVIVAALLFAADRSPQKSLFGIRYYTVLTPSMEPTYSVGDMVFVQLRNADRIFVGDVITFNPSETGDAYLTHRVTQKLENYEGSGVTCFRTKGDANDSEDSFLIDEKRVIGTVKFCIPKLGYVVRFVQLRWYFVLPVLALIWLFFRLLRMYFVPREDEEDNEVKAQGESAEVSVPAAAPPVPGAETEKK